MQVEPNDDIRAADDVASAGSWADMLEVWNQPRPVIVVGDTKDGPLVRYVDDISDNPTVFRGVPIDPFDPSTYTPTDLDSITDPIHPPLATLIYPTIRAWYATEVNEGFA